MLADYERSIAKYQIGTFAGGPFNRLLASRSDESLDQRRVIPVHDSLATVQELQQRQKRMHYLVNSSGLFQLQSPEALGLPSQCALEKLRQGIHDALRIAEHLGDFAADPSLYTSTDGGENEQQKKNNNDNKKNKKQESEGPVAVGYADATAEGQGLFAENDEEIAAYHAEVAKQRTQTLALRNAQTEAVKRLSSRDLAWLITLGEAAARAYRRYEQVELRRDTEMGDYRVIGFSELVLRGGTHLAWAFAQGRGVLARSLKAAVWDAAGEARAYELGHFDDENDVPEGLRCAATCELQVRVRKAMEAEAAAQGDVFTLPEGEPEPIFFVRQALLEVRRIVGQEIGWQQWLGY